MIQEVRFVLGTVVCAYLAYYAGAMLNFEPFLANDLAIRAVGHCMWVTWIFMAICTCRIIRAIDRIDKK